MDVVSTRIGHLMILNEQTYEFQIIPSLVSVVEVVVGVIEGRVSTCLRWWFVNPICLVRECALGDLGLGLGGWPSS